MGSLEGLALDPDWWKSVGNGSYVGKPVQHSALYRRGFGYGFLLDPQR